MSESKKCVICGFDRILDRAHLIPRKITEGIVGLKRNNQFYNKYVILLCRNHHFLFDNNKLNEDEWKILKPLFQKIHNELFLLVNSNLIPGNQKARLKQKNKEKRLEKWKKMLTGRVIFPIHE